MNKQPEFPEYVRDMEIVHILRQMSKDQEELPLLSEHSLFSNSRTSTEA